jgi:REP element-mobilizing transposase RayT
MPQSLAALYCHVVFSTRNREPLIDPEWEDRLYGYVGGILGNRKCLLLIAGGMPDHVHLLVSLARTWSVADLVRDVKSNSSAWIHEEIPDMRHFSWQDGYGAFSVSVSQLDAVRKYVAGQKEHHARQSYQDEFRAILKRHGVEYDERYVWD